MNLHEITPAISARDHTCFIARDHSGSTHSLRRCNEWHQGGHHRSRWRRLGGHSLGKGYGLHRHSPLAQVWAAAASDGAARTQSLERPLRSAHPRRHAGGYSAAVSCCTHLLSYAHPSSLALCVRSHSKAALAKELGADAYVASGEPTAMKAAAGSLDLILNFIPTMHAY